MRTSANHSRTRRAGFTLLELVVVVAVLAIVAGAAVPAARKAVDRAARRATDAELEVLAAAAQACFEDTEALPEAVSALERDPGLAGWTGPYLARSGRDARTGRSVAELDGWGTPYRLVRSGDSRLELSSAGPSREFGDGDDRTLVLDVTPVRRAVTLERLEVLNGAIGRYNAARGTDAPLPVEFSALLRRLVSAGFLPDDDPWRTDGFGRAFRPEPPDRGPVVRVVSPSLAD